MGEALAVAVSELVDAPLLSLSAQELTAELREDFAVAQQLSARILAVVHQAAVVGVPSAQAASSTGVWLAETLGMSIRQATMWAKLADRLPSVPVVEQAQVIGHGRGSAGGGRSGGQGAGGGGADPDRR